MVKAVRAISIERGYDPKEFSLMAFGGGGPLHARGVAREGEPTQFVNFRVTAQGIIRKRQLRRRHSREGSGSAIVAHREVYVDDRAPELSLVYDRTRLLPGERIVGPTVVEQMDSTTLVFPEDKAQIDFERGDRVEDVFELILLNIRVPKERMGDYRPHFASLRLGVRRMMAVYKKSGKEALSEAIDAILEASERQIRAGIAQIHDGGYSFEDFVDDDGFGTENIPIRVKITVEGDHITLDFSGSPPQVKGNINISWSGIQATVAYALKCLIDPTVPSNDGFYRPIRIVAPEGSIVNAALPDASAGRAQTCQRVVDVIVGALAQAVPERAVGAANGSNTTAIFYGKNPEIDEYYVYLETYGGGFGGRSTKDGKDGVQVHITNRSSLPIEALESEYPLFIETYALIPDSGGAGKYRGGLGLRRDVRIIGHTRKFSAQRERFVLQPWGIFGGNPGAIGKLVLHPGTEGETILHSKVSDIEIQPDEVISIRTPGAGGYEIHTKGTEN